MTHAYLTKPDIKGLLDDLGRGEHGARDRLIDALYPGLRDLMQRRLGEPQSDHTIHNRDLLHEAYTKLVGDQGMNWQSRALFLEVAAPTMRRILVDRALESGRAGSIRLTGAGVAAEVSFERLIAIDRALKRLETEHPDWVRVTEARYFAGLTIEETAHALGMSRGTVLTSWRMARAWLLRNLGA